MLTYLVCMEILKEACILGRMLPSDLLDVRIFISNSNEKEEKIKDAVTLIFKREHLVQLKQSF